MDFTQQVLKSVQGGTARLDGGDIPTTGYFVGGLVSPLILTVGDTHYSDEDVEALNQFVDYLVNTIHAQYLGWWTDEETGNLWVDASTWHAGLDDAENIGRGRREIAIYDVERQREVRLYYRPADGFNFSNGTLGGSEF
jgi:hypothetical protein